MTDNKTVEQESCKENTQGRSWIWRFTPSLCVSRLPFPLLPALVRTSLGSVVSEGDERRLNERPYRHEEDDNVSCFQSSVNPES